MKYLTAIKTRFLAPTPNKAEIVVVIVSAVLAILNLYPAAADQYAAWVEIGINVLSGVGFIGIVGTRFMKRDGVKPKMQK